MKLFLPFFCFLIGLYLLPLLAKAQLPVYNGPGSTIIYYVPNPGSDTIYNYDPSLPISPTNPTANTIHLASNSGGLAICNNLNAPSPSPTFYIAGTGSTYYYYNGTNWVNTNYSIGGVDDIAGGGDISTVLIMGAEMFINIMAQLMPACS